MEDIVLAVPVQPVAPQRGTDVLKPAAPEHVRWLAWNLDARMRQTITAAAAFRMQQPCHSLALYADLAGLAEGVPNRADLRTNGFTILTVGSFWELGSRIAMVSRYVDIDAAGLWLEATEYLTGVELSSRALDLHKVLAAMPTAARPRTPFKQPRRSRHRSARLVPSQ